MLKGISSLIVILLILIIAGIGTSGYILTKQPSTTTTSSTTTIIPHETIIPPETTTTTVKITTRSTTKSTLTLTTISITSTSPITTTSIKMTTTTTTILPTCGEQGGTICSTNDGCVCYGKVLTSSNAKCCCTGSCGPTEGTIPEDVTKIWFESIIAGDWTKTFTYTVDVNGSVLSEDCKQKFKNFLNSWVGSALELKVEDATPCTGKYTPPGVIMPPGIEITCVPYSYNMTTIGGSKSGTQSFSELLNINGNWKFGIACQYFP